MGWLFYLEIGLAAFGLIGLGGLILPGAAWVRRLMASLVVFGSLAGCLVWLAPSAIVPLCRGTVAVGIVLATIEVVRAIRSSGLPRPSGQSMARLALATLIGLAFALPYQVNFVNIGDNNYFLGQLVEIFQADYVGPLRVPSAYPLELSASHVMATAPLALLLSLVGPVTMLDGLEARFLLTALIAIRFSFVILGQSRQSLIWSALLLICGWGLFHHEMIVASRESTFFYLLLSFELALALVFDPADDPKRRMRDALFLLVAMAGAKASIFYLPALVGLWMLVRAPFLAVHPAIWLCGLANFLQLALTALRPKPFADVSIKLSLVNPSGGRALFNYYPELFDALTSPEGLLGRLPFDYSVGAIAVLVMVAVKYWLLPVRAADRLATPETREILRVAELFFLVVLIGLVLIRHDQHGVTHQIWLIYGSAPVALALILAFALREGAGSGRWRAGLVAGAILVLAIGYRPWQPIQAPTSPHLGGLTLSELRQMPPGQALAPRAGDSVTDPCERALLKGERIAAGTVPPSCLGMLGALVVKKETP